MRTVDLQVDVTEAAGLGEPAHIAATVHAPDEVGAEPVVCFAKPGGGYSRRYYTVDLPGPTSGAQAEWHTRRGWIFVSVDHLGVGDSSTGHDGVRLDFTTLAAAGQAAETELLRRLADGTLVEGLAAVTNPLRLGIGQSMGGAMTIVQQGRYHCYDGIAILGFSAVHTHPPVAPGDPPIAAPWLPRDTGLRDPMVVVNAPVLTAAQQTASLESWKTMAWGFHYDDIPADVIAADMDRSERFPPWASATVPDAVAFTCLAPGAVATEAASVTAPVLVAMGERDVIADPKGEPRAYLSARSVDLVICPRMGHMHNFAGTRELMWQRIATWAEWVRAARGVA